MSLRRAGIRLGVGALLALSGCASLPVRPGALELTVTPAVLHPGDVVRVSVKAPEGTHHVTGTLDVPGSPRLPLKSRDNGRTWTFTTQIPVDAVWQPGRYRAEVQGRAADGSLLTGEAWITAP